jgi:hypothetical protein
MNNPRNFGAHVKNDILLDGYKDSSVKEDSRELDPSCQLSVNSLISLPTFFLEQLELLHEGLKIS